MTLMMAVPAVGKLGKWLCELQSQLLVFLPFQVFLLLLLVSIILMVCDLIMFVINCR